MVSGVARRLLSRNDRLRGGPWGTGSWILRPTPYLILPRRRPETEGVRRVRAMRARSRGIWRRTSTRLATTRRPRSTPMHAAVRPRLSRRRRRLPRPGHSVCSACCRRRFRKPPPRVRYRRRAISCSTCSPVWPPRALSPQQPRRRARQALAQPRLRPRPPPRRRRRREPMQRSLSRPRPPSRGNLRPLRNLPRKQRFRWRPRCRQFKQPPRRRRPQRRRTPRRRPNSLPSRPRSRQRWRR